MELNGADETTFLCGYSHVRRYGTTLTAKQPPSNHYAIHHIEATDTMQGIALRYNTTVTELKRINKLWINDSISLKSYLKVPCPKTSAGLRNVHISRTNSPTSTISEPESVKDILSRIDNVIKHTSQSVHRLERESSIVHENLEYPNTLTSPPHLSSSPSPTSIVRGYSSAYQVI